MVWYKISYRCSWFPDDVFWWLFWSPDFSICGFEPQQLLDGLPWNVVILTFYNHQAYNLAVECLCATYGEWKLNITLCRKIANTFRSITQLTVSFWVNFGWICIWSLVSGLYIFWIDCQNLVQAFMFPSGSTVITLVMPNPFQVKVSMCSIPWFMTKNLTWIPYLTFPANLFPLSLSVLQIFNKPFLLISCQIMKIVIIALPFNAFFFKPLNPAPYTLDPVI